MARACGRVHPRDWIEIYESHTPYEWQLQRMLMGVDPWGDERADLREALNTLANHPTTSDREELLGELTGYLTINKRNEIAGPEAMRRMLES